MTPETIAWNAVAEELPDVDTTVLVNCPDFAEPVQLGWYDGVFWFSDDEDFEDGDVIAWAPVPRGIA